MTTSTIFVGNSSVARVAGLRDEDGTFDNNATVTLESLTNESQGGAVGGVTTPLTLTYVPDSDGLYEAPLPHNVAVTPGDWYLGVFQVVTASGLRGKWTERIRAATRSA